ncbi:MAG: DPP IV N-terminal domain-containing protein [Bacteroidia bacterium]
MNYAITCVMLLFFSTATQAQKVMSIEQTIDRSLSPKTLYQLAFRGETNRYVYVERPSWNMVEGDDNTAPTPILTLEDLNTALIAAGGEKLAYFPPATWENSQKFSFSDATNLWQYDFGRKAVTRVVSWKEDATSQDMVSNGNTAYVTNGNLFVITASNNKTTKITEGDGYQIVYGMPAHRNEFGIEKGTFWSNNGQMLAFYRVDQSQVTDYPLAKWSEPTAKNENIKYPMAGATSHFATVGVYDIKNGKTIYLQTGKPDDQYLTNITWSPDDKYIYIAVVNRDQNEMKVNRYEAKTGKFIMTLFTEKHEKYVEPKHALHFLPNKEDEFLFYSERDGYMHLYHYQADGRMVKQVTSGNWEVDEILGFDKKGESVLISARKESPLESHLYKVKLKTGEMNLFTFDKGMHNLAVSKDGTRFLDTYSNLTTPNVSQIGDAESGKILSKFMTADNPLKDYKVGEISLGTVKSSDGTTDLHYRLIKPIDFDKNKKYPVMVYVYGGPHVQLVQNRWLGGADGFLLYMASQGYVVFTLDSRGSDGRGLDFENATHRQLGTMEVADQMAGVNFLKTLPYVNSSKMAVFGWSFGGFMTTSLMLKQPNTFQVGVAGGPVIDWKYYEIMYTERYMDTPAQNPDGYKAACLINYVDKLTGKLLIIHGLQDDTVVPQHTSAFVNECIAKGILIDYFPYPNHPHNVRGKDRIHLYKKVADYIQGNL